MPSFKPTIIAFILAVVCVAAAWYTWSRDKLGAEESVEVHPLFAEGAIPAESLQRITLTRRGELALVFARTADGWRQTEPFDYPMQAYSMQRFAHLANQAEVSSQLDPRALSGGQSLAGLSLDPPLATLTFEWPDGAETLFFGRRAYGGRAYLRREGIDDILVVNQDLHDRVLDESPNLWRRTRLFEHAGTGSIRVVADVPGGIGYTMTRERRRWRLTEPVQTRLDQPQVQMRLGELFELNTQNFIIDQPGDVTQFGLHKPLATITVVTPVTTMIDNQPQTNEVTERLLIGSPRTMEEREFFAMIEDRPVVLALSKETISRLLAFGHLIATTASGVDPADVGAIWIIGEDEFTIVRDPEDPTQWLSVEQPNAEVSAAVVNTLLSHLTALRATDAVLGEIPIDKKVATISLGRSTGEWIDTVLVGKLDDGTWAMSNGDGVVRVYPAGLDLALTPEAFGLR